MEGGSVTIAAQGDIGHYYSPDDGMTLLPDSARELPTSWLDRRGFTQNGVFASSQEQYDGVDEIASTSWWVDFSNFLEGIGALGGGNVTLTAGGNISNVDAVVPTNARMPGLKSQGQAIAPDASALVELGGGDLVVSAGDNIDGGVYYVERGHGALSAGNSIITNSTRTTIAQSALQTLNAVPNSTTWLPTTLFLGEGSFDVNADNNILLGPVANPFLLPENLNNSFFDKTYFSTYASTDAVNVTSLTGDVVLKDNTITGYGSLQGWYDHVLDYSDNTTSGITWSFYEPWLQLDEALTAGATSDPFTTLYELMPATLRVTAFSGDIDTSGKLTLSPSPQGTIDFFAAGSINGLQPNVIASASRLLSTTNPIDWSTSTIDLSDTNPGFIPGIADPFSLATPATSTSDSPWSITSSTLFNGLNALFAETGSTQSLLQTQEILHADIDGQTLHADDPDPLQLYAGTGDISGITLYAGKSADVVAGQDITDIAFYLQNNQADNISVVSAGRDILPYDATSPLRVELEEETPKNNVLPLAGDIQIAGPGTLEVLAGRDLNLGVSTTTSTNGTGLGITSIGNQSNPYLPFAGSDIIAAAAIGGSDGLDSSSLNFSNSTAYVPEGGATSIPAFSGFIDQFLDPVHGAAESSIYLPDLGVLLGLSNASDAEIWTQFLSLPVARRDTLALTIFYDVLRDAGRDHTANGSDYTAGFQAIAALFPDYKGGGDITLTSREIKTESGGNISLFAPGGQLTVGLPVAGTAAVNQGILTVDGGNISIFANGDVNVGTSRIFTLNGGNEIIWSTVGNIAAGASSKTVQSAPPTRVLVDPQSGNVETDLAGLATGGGIGVLETDAGAPPSDVDLIAPNGFVDAGDAGIRASGNLNIAAVRVLNASNISIGGKSSGVPTPSASNIGSLAAASSATGAANSTANAVAGNSQPQPEQTTELPSIITVEVLGYGGGDVN
jgi:hypothetical protein